jgi:hypothetical protein
MQISLDFFATTSSSSIGAGDNGGVIGMSSSGIVGVALVGDAETTSSALVVFREVFVAVLLLRLRREDNSLLALGVLRLDLGRGASGRLCTKSLPTLALVYLSAISKSLSMEVSSSFMESFSFILMSAMPMENKKMTSLLEIPGILLHIWLKRWMYYRRVLPLY